MLYSCWAESPGIVSVFPDPVLKLHTTRSWDFLQVESGEVGAKAVRPPVDGDVIIGMIDTGEVLYGDCLTSLDDFEYVIACLQ